MNQEEHTILIAKLNKKLQCLSLVYVVILMHVYLLIETWSLWQYCEDIAAVNDNGIVEFNACNAANSFSFTAKIRSQTGNDGIIHDVEIILPLNY